MNRPDSLPAQIGATFAQRATLDAVSIREFAELSRDGNPLHHDEAVATQKGVPSTMPALFTRRRVASIS
ncbi:MAG: hypothetical protein ACR2HE_09370 [Casimicrobiaceae bacterium]